MNSPVLGPGTDPDNGKNASGAHERMMSLALAEAERAFEEGEVPVGAVIVHESRIIGKAHNQKELLRDPTAHAEILAITQAAEALGNWRLTGCRLYVTLEPCAMCAGAILQARIPHVIYGCDDPKAGAMGSVVNLIQPVRFNHRVEVVRGIMKEPCQAILKEFFATKRSSGPET